jgi:hypothetical protein
MKLISVAICLSFGVGFAPAATPARSPEAPPPSNPREFFNAGTRELNEGKLREAEASLESALASQDDRLQPRSLYNLGHVRFGMGLEDLKKGPSAQPSIARSRAASQMADKASRDADAALATDDVQKLVAAYLRGRGARRELKAATEVVRQALQVHRSVLGKWQRSSGDFKSTVELNRVDDDAQANADTVDRQIAKLVDTLGELAQAAATMGKNGEELKEKLKQLRGRIPAPNMPPGAAGDEDDDDTPKGPQEGQKEGAGKQGEEISLSPEEAGWLLNGFKLDSERRLPMGQESTAQPKDRSGRTW